MTIISKYDDLNRNILVLGAGVIQFLKKKSYTTEGLFQEFCKSKNIELNQFLNLITFLWLLELIEMSGNRISIKTRL